MMVILYIFLGIQVVQWGALIWFWIRFKKTEKKFKELKK
jgi:hypothetical protein